MRKATTALLDSTSIELPNHFEDNEILQIIETALIHDNTTLRSVKPPFPRKYPLICGLCVLLRNAVDRLSRRTKLLHILSTYTTKHVLFTVIKAFTSQTELLLSQWDQHSFYDASQEIINKSITLSPDLKKSLFQQPLIHSTHSESLIQFELKFLRKIHDYHKNIERPEGTFECSDLMSNLQLQQLSLLPRELCPQCNGKRQVYCGECAGYRMPNARCLLPQRIVVPFDILLVVHWHETLHKCTGVHTGALAAEGTMSVVRWTKEETWNGAVWNDNDEEGEESTLCKTASNEAVRNEFEITTHENGAEDSCSIARGFESKTDIQFLVRKEVDPLLKSSVMKTALTMSDDEFSTCPEWMKISLMLDSRYDVLLFPSPDAVDAAIWDWNSLSKISEIAEHTTSSVVSPVDVNDDTSSGVDSSTCKRRATDLTSLRDCSTAKVRYTMSKSKVKPSKWRLVVIESTWVHGKGVARRINSCRRKFGFEPIVCLRLNNIIGQYWRFQSEGHSAVSSIEAIAYTALVAGASEHEYNTLLTLFRLQKYRVMKNVQDGRKPPRVVQVTGSGLGSWEPLTKQFD